MVQKICLYFLNQLGYSTFTSSMNGEDFQHKNKMLGFDNQSESRCDITSDSLQEQQMNIADIK